MALRREDLYEGTDAVVVDFPVRIARARARRTTRERLERRVAAWALALGLTAAAIAGSAAAGQPEATSRPGAPSSVVVAAGETVSDLAERYAAEGSDLSAYAEALAALNGIQGVAPPGTELELP